MKNLISAALAGNILLGAMGLLFIFYLLVSFRVISANIIWGGMIDNTSLNLITLEITALFVTLLFMIIIAAKSGYIEPGKFAGAINAPITIILEFFALWLAIEK